MYILGDRNWQLPAWLGWLPRFHIEPVTRSAERQLTPQHRVTGRL
jgi:hypothetical protein